MLPLCINTFILVCVYTWHLYMCLSLCACGCLFSLAYSYSTFKTYWWHRCGWSHVSGGVRSGQSDVTEQNIPEGFKLPHTQPRSRYPRLQLHLEFLHESILNFFLRENWFADAERRRIIWLSKPHQHRWLKERENTCLYFKLITLKVH